MEVLTRTQNYQNIANTIRNKYGISDLMYPSEMANYITDTILLKRQDLTLKELLEAQPTSWTEPFSPLSRVYSDTVTVMDTEFNYPDCIFADSNKYFKKVYAPECLTLSPRAFNNQQEIEFISLPKCENVAGSAFYMDAKLKSVYFGAESIEFKSSAFFECNALSTITLNNLSVSITAPASNIFPKNISKFYCNPILLNNLKNDSYWSYFSTKLVPIQDGETV